MGLFAESALTKLRKGIKAMSDNRCVCCGEQIPEGTMICPKCHKEYTGYEKEVNRISKRAERFNNIMDDWVIPIGLGAVVILWIIGIIKGMN